MNIRIEQINGHFYRVYWCVGSGEHSVSFDTEGEAKAYQKGAKHIFEEMTEYLPRHLERAERLKRSSSANIEGAHGVAVDAS